MVWQATLWVIWKVRNNRIFNDVGSSADDIVDEVKMFSWRWALSRLKILTCLYYEWCWNPWFFLGV